MRTGPGAVTTRKQTAKEGAQILLFHSTVRTRKWLWGRSGPGQIPQLCATLTLLGAIISLSHPAIAEIAPRAHSSDTPSQPSEPSVASDPLFDGYVNVRTYGAKGDGATDDTDAFKSAVASSPQGSTIFVPPGKYRLTHDISYAASRSVSWRGAGHGSVLAFDGAGLVVTGGNEETVKRLSIEALRIERRGSAGPALALDGSASAGVSRWALRDLHVVSSSGTGIYVEGGWIGTMDNVIVMRSQIGIQIEMNRASRNSSMNALTVTGGEVQGCTEGWRIKGVAGLTMRGHAVEGNVRGITATDTPRGINIDGGYFEHNTSYDISFEGPAAGYGNSIRDSLFFSPGRGRATASAILLQIGKNFIIDGNSFVGYTGAAVRVTDTVGTTTGNVRGNYLSSTPLELSNAGKAFADSQ